MPDNQPYDWETREDYEARMRRQGLESLDYVTEGLPLGHPGREEWVGHGNVPVGKDEFPRDFQRQPGAEFVGTSGGEPTGVMTRPEDLAFSRYSVRPDGLGVSEVEVLGPEEARLARLQEEGLGGAPSLRPPAEFAEIQRRGEAEVLAGMKPMDRLEYLQSVSHAQTLGDIEETGQRKKEAALETGRLQKEQAAAQSAAMERANKEAAEHDKRLKEIDRQAGLAADKRIMDMKMRLDAYENKKVDQNLFRRKGTGNVIAMIAGAVMGGIVQMRTGRKDNPALDMLNRAIERDVQIQEREIARAGQALGMRNSIYQMEAQNWDNKRDRVLAGKVRLLEAARREVETIGIRYTGPLAEQNTQMIIAGIEQEQTKLNLQLRDSIFGKNVTILRLREQRRMNNARLASMRREEARKKERHQAALVAGGGLNWSVVPGTPHPKDSGSPWAGRWQKGTPLVLGVMNPKLRPVAREKRQQELSAGHNGLAVFAEYIELIKKNQGVKIESFDDATQRKIRALHNALAVSSRNMFETGVMTDKDFKRWSEDILPGMDTWKAMFKGGQVKTLESWREKLLAKQKSLAANSLMDSASTRYYIKHMEDFYKTGWRAAGTTNEEASWLTRVDTPSEIAKQLADPAAQEDNVSGRIPHGTVSKKRRVILGRNNEAMKAARKRAPAGRVVESARIPGFGKVRYAVSTPKGDAGEYKIIYGKVADGIAKQATATTKMLQSRPYQPITAEPTDARGIKAKHEKNKRIEHAKRFEAELYGQLAGFVETQGISYQDIPGVNAKEIRERVEELFRNKYFQKRYKAAKKGAPLPEDTTRSTSLQYESRRVPAGPLKL